MSNTTLAKRGPDKTSLAAIDKSLGILAPRLNELGKIKIGGLGGSAQAQSGNNYRKPVKYDHFIVTTMHREGGIGDGDLMMDTALMDELLPKYGSPATNKSKPGLKTVLRELPIWLPTNDVDDVLQSAWVWYRGKTQIGARSDGEKVTWFCDPRTGDVLPEAQVGDWKEKFAKMKFGGNPMFKLNSEFSCLIAAKEARFGGIYKFRTTSEITYKQLRSSLVNITMLTTGVLRNMPLVMVLKPVKVNPMVKGKKTPGTVYAVHVELRGSDIQSIQQKARDELAWDVEHEAETKKLRMQYRAMLALPGTETGEAITHVVREYAPEAMAASIRPAPAHLDILDGPADEQTTTVEQPQETEPVGDLSNFDPGDVTDAEFTEADADDVVPDEPVDEPPAQPEYGKYVDANDVNDGDEYDAYLRSQQEQPAGADILDDLGVKAPAPKRQATATEEALTKAAIERDPTPKPVTSKSTADEFLTFVVTTRPTRPGGEASDPIGAQVIAAGRMKAWLPKPWDKLTPAQRHEAITKVKAGKFPWPGSST